MKLKFEGGVLTLVPENEADRAEFAAAFGQPEQRESRNGGHEYSGAAWGHGVTLQADGSVEVSVREAWWNHDPVYD